MRTRSLALCLALLAPTLVPAAAPAQALPHIPKAHPVLPAQPGQGPSRFGARPAPLTPAPTRATATVTEVEPNDSIYQATLVALYDTIAGASDVLYDVDWFAVDLTAGTHLLLDVDANQLGSALDPIMVLLDRDSVTLLTYDDDSDGLDSRITYDIPADGRYFFGIADYSGRGGPDYWYQIRVDTAPPPPPPPPPGPGDTATVFALNVGYPYATAADAHGNLYVLDAGSERILRVDASGSVTSVATADTAIYGFVDLVVDGFGDVLATGFGSAGELVVRIDPSTGERSTFATTLEYASGITVGPDGDVWVGASSGMIRRYDPFGVPKDSVSTQSVPYRLRFSPDGDLYFIDGYQNVYRVHSGAVQSVLSTGESVDDLAFDRDGFLYLSDYYLGEVHLFDPNFQEVGDVFARADLYNVTGLAFGRDASGAMTSRLFATASGYFDHATFTGAVVELNPAGVRAPGFQVGIDLLQVAHTSSADAAMGAEYADTLRIASGEAASSWELTGGSLPDGVKFDAQTGVLSGVPQQDGTFTFTVRVTAGDRFGLGRFTLTVNQPDVSVNAGADDLLGVTGALTPDLERYLDLQGNHNGKFDVGDLRAYLRRMGQLNASVASRKENQP